MKTRIVHTHIHFEDDWFSTLTLAERYLFMYLFTNRYIGQTGAYKITKRVACMETGATPKEWLDALGKFESDGKIKRVDDWVIVLNARKHSNYAGKKNEEAFRKEFERLPQKVRNEMEYSINTLSYSSDTTINNKSKIINPNTETINHIEEELDVDEIDKGIEAMIKAKQ